MMVKHVQSRQKTLGLLNESPLHILVCAKLFLKVVQPRIFFYLYSSNKCIDTAGSNRGKTWDRWFKTQGLSFMSYILSCSVAFRIVSASKYCKSLLERDLSLKPNITKVSLRVKSLEVKTELLKRSFFAFSIVSKHCMMSLLSIFTATEKSRWVVSLLRCHECIW